MIRNFSSLLFLIIFLGSCAVSTRHTAHKDPISDQVFVELKQMSYSQSILSSYRQLISFRWARPAGIEEDLWLHFSLNRSASTYRELDSLVQLRVKPAQDQVLLPIQKREKNEMSSIISSNVNESTRVRSKSQVYDYGSIQISPAIQAQILAGSELHLQFTAGSDNLTYSWIEGKHTYVQEMIKEAIFLGYQEKYLSD